MATPKGMRSQHIAPEKGDAAHRYSKPGKASLQRRRHIKRETLTPIPEPAVAAAYAQMTKQEIETDRQMSAASLRAQRRGA